MTGETSGAQPGIYDRAQAKVYFLLESPANHNLARRIVIYFIMAMILSNVLAIILETKHELFIAYAPYFIAFDVFSAVVFTIEYLLRLWCCVRNPRYSAPVKGRIRYALSPLALIDLLAITPFYLPLIIPTELRMLRMIRLLRVFRVLKLGRYSSAFETFIDVIKAKKEELSIALIMTVIILILASSALYLTEHEVQPEKFASIPDAMWWAVITLATVGYGDVYPITPLGKFISAIVALSAIGLFALPAGILATGFAETLNQRHAKACDITVTCPQCGNRFNPHEEMSNGSPDGNDNNNRHIKEPDKPDHQ